MNLITGVPGSGKTEFAISMARESLGPVLYLSFSAENAQSAKTRFGDLAACMSIHAFTRRILQLRPDRICEQWGNSQLKVAVKSTGSDLKESNFHHFLELFSAFIKSNTPIYRARALLSGPKFRILSDLTKAQLHSSLLKIWDWIWSSNQVVNHDMYLKYAIDHIGQINYSLVIVDECQDLSESMMSVIEAIEIANEGLQIYLFGDLCQQIFGYRGVSKKINEMKPVKQLTESHRFGPSVAKLMNLFMKKQGIQEFSPISLTSRATTLIEKNPGWDSLIRDAIEGRKITVITRLNMSIWNLAMTLVANNVKFAVKGQSMGDLDLLESLWISYRNQQNSRQKNSDRRYKQYRDNASFSNDRNAISACKFIESIPSDGAVFFQRLRSCLVEQREAQVLLSNIHQAKGLQFNDVVIAGDFQECIEPLSGSVFKIPAEEVYAIYTAITRCRGRLTLPSDWFSFYEKHCK